MSTNTFKTDLNVEGLLRVLSSDGVTEHLTIDPTTGDARFSNEIFAKGPFRDVKAFGAVGDGTTDDTNAFIDVDAYVAANGGTVYISPGTYNVEMIEVTCPNWLGAGRGLSALRSRSGDTVLKFSVAMNWVSLSQFSIHNTGSFSAGADGGHGINVAFAGDAPGWTIDRVDVSGMAGNQMRFTSHLFSSTIRNCFVSASIGTTTTDLIYIDSCGPGMLLDNVYWGDVDSGDYGLRVIYGHIHLRGCNGINGGGGNWANFGDGGSGVVFATVENCNIEDFGAIGIKVQAVSVIVFQGTNIWLGKASTSNLVAIQLATGISAHCLSGRLAMQLNGGASWKNSEPVHFDSFNVVVNSGVGTQGLATAYNDTDGVVVTLGYIQEGQDFWTKYPIYTKMGATDFRLGAQKVPMASNSASEPTYYDPASTTYTSLARWIATAVWPEASGFQSVTGSFSNLLSLSLTPPLTGIYDFTGTVAVSWSAGGAVQFQLYDATASAYIAHTIRTYAMQTGEALSCPLIWPTVSVTSGHVIELHIKSYSGTQIAGSNADYRSVFSGKRDL